MDPTATLTELLAAIESNDAQTALEASVDLGDWLAKGGAMPDVATAVRGAIPARIIREQYTAKPEVVVVAEPAAAGGYAVRLRFDDEHDRSPVVYGGTEHDCAEPALVAANVVTAVWGAR